MPIYWQDQFRYWIQVTQEKIQWWESSDPCVVSAKIHLRKEGINFEKVFLEKWRAQVKAWQADIDKAERELLDSHK